MSKNNKMSIKLKQIIAFMLISIVVINLLKIYHIESISVVVTFLITIFMAGKNTFSNNLAYSLSTVFNLFVLIFLGIAPMVQYLEGISVWGGEPFKDLDYLKTNLLIILSLLIYKYNYRRIIGKDLCRNTQSYDERVKSVDVSGFRLVTISFFAALYIFFVFNGNIHALLLRSEYSESGVTAGGTSYLLNMFVFRPIPAICFLIYLFNRGKSMFVKLFLLFLMLLTNFPTGMPRFAVAAFYIPICFYCFKFLKKPLNFAFILTFALIFVFPVLNMFRTGIFTELSLDYDMFNTGHFDSYQMFMRVVSRNYITWGLQLLGVLFFFIPRSIWPAKPVGSGYWVAQIEGYHFDNISMNFLGEGYINFGIVGVAVFALIISYINASMDKKYWFNTKSTIFVIIYLELLGMEFIIMRGALLNIYPALIAYSFMTFFINKLVSKKYHLR